jgi:hypothetical protein
VLVQRLRLADPNYPSPVLLHLKVQSLAVAFPGKQVVEAEAAGMEMATGVAVEMAGRTAGETLAAAETSQSGSQTLIPCDISN